MDGSPSATVRPRPGELAAWARQHRSAWRDAGFFLAQDILNSLLTALVIGVALALPTGLYVVFESVEAAAVKLNLAPQATLFLRPAVTREQGEALAARLRADPRVAGAAFVGRDLALAEFKASSGLEKVLDALPDNPLPHLITLSLRPGAQGALKPLLEGLGSAAEVAEAHYDLSWIARLHAFAALLGRGISALAVLLGMGVVLIVGNAIRVAIQRRREEIEVTKLCGATDVYVRRPFLYLGSAFGLGGGMVAIAILALVFGWLEAPLAELSGLYGFTLGATGLGFRHAFGVLGAALGLGWAGGWLAVTLHLRSFEPRVG